MGCSISFVGFVALYSRSTTSFSNRPDVATSNLPASATRETAPPIFSGLQPDLLIIVFCKDNSLRTTSNVLLLYVGVDRRCEPGLVSLHEHGTRNAQPLT